MNKGFILTAQYGGSDNTWALADSGLFYAKIGTPRVFDTAQAAAEALGGWAKRCPSAMRPDSFHDFNVVEYEEDDTVALSDVPPGHLVERDSDGFKYVTIHPNGFVENGWSWVVTMRGRLNRLSRSTRVLDLGHVDDTTITTTK